MFAESITIAIPAYDEAETIVDVVNEARTVLQGITNDYEVLVVDDGSTDGTSALVDEMRAQDREHIRVIHHEQNRGFAGAIKSCYGNASKDWVFLAPADKQVDISELNNFIPLTQNADIIVGYRLYRAEPFYRSLNSFLFHSLCRILFGIRLKQISTSKLYRRRILQAITIEASPSSAMIEPEVIYKAMRMGARFAEVGMHHYPRAAGRPKGSNPMMIVRTFREMFRMWWILRVKGMDRLESKSTA